MLAQRTRWHLDADVIIVGYGSAGAVAAITAYDAGAQVVILENLLTLAVIDFGLLWDNSPKGSRKEFAIWTNANASMFKRFMFQKMDGNVNMEMFRDVVTQE